MMLKWGILLGGTLLLLIALVMLNQFFALAMLVLGWMEGSFMVWQRRRT
jgi:hypothetical protein